MSGMPLGQASLVIVPVGFGIQQARNLAWYRAGIEGWEYFMFWDDDMEAPPGAVETMLETMEQNPEIDILGGVYPARQTIPAPIVLREKGGNPWWGWEDGGIHRVWMTGTGFTMYRMDRLNQLEAPSHPYDWQGERLDIPQVFRLDKGTDDYALAVDAEAAGLRWYVHGGIVCNQIEGNGKRFEVRDARQRITEEAQDGTEDQESGVAGGDDAGGGRSMGSREAPRPADVRAG
jgi:glycosyltransferase involved in cell wall biosynthesis